MTESLLLTHSLMVVIPGRPITLLQQGKYNMTLM